MGKPQPRTDPILHNTLYGLEFFMEKHGLSRTAAEVLLRSNGPSRQRCDHAAIAHLKLCAFARPGRKRLSPEHQNLTRIIEPDP